jgi:hypothetical protein
MRTAGIGREDFSSHSGEDRDDLITYSNLSLSTSLTKSFKRDTWDHYVSHYFLERAQRDTDNLKRSRTKGSVITIK